MRVLAIGAALFATPAGAQEMSHAQHQGMETASPVPQEEVGDAPAPPIPADHAADRIWSADRMAPARAALMDESRVITTGLRIDQLEYRAGNGRDGYSWDAELSHGGDIDRFVLASEGEGAFGRSAERVEVRALWRHALDPWWNFQAGVRHDFHPKPERTYATIGIMGLAPYWFEVEGQLLISQSGDLHLRANASYDQRITQRIILEPEIELDAALQNVPQLRVASGFERLELGARLRYQATLDLAPYIGVHWESTLARTADQARDRGDKVAGLSAVFGISGWF